MKKLLSIILVITMTLSSLSIFPAAVSADGTLTFDYEFGGGVVTFTCTGQGTFSDIPAGEDPVIDIYMEYDPGDLEFIDGSIKFTGSKSAADEFIDMDDGWFSLAAIIPYDENGYAEASVSISFKVLRASGETFIMYDDSGFGFFSNYIRFEGDEWESTGPYERYITLTVPSYIDCGQHSYSEWIIDTDADCTSDGKKHKVCPTCGDTVTEIIPALGHSYGEWVQNSDGMDERECSACGNIEVESAFVKKSGSCGDNLTWELFSNGTLKISGTGEMTDYYSNLPAPWYVSHASIERVIIENGVTSIGHYAFYGCDSLTSVTIPDSVTNIINYAFHRCSSLISVTIPDKVRYIGDRTFYGCSSLISVTIPDSVISIGESSFSDCVSLTSMTIPDSVTSIGYSTFSGCSSLTSVTIPDSVTRINGYAFDDCSSLTDVYYGGSELDWEKISIGSNNDPLINANIIYAIKDEIIASGTCGANLTWELFSDGTLEISGTGKMTDYYHSYSPYVPWYSNRSSIKKVIIESGVTSIGDWAFYDCSSLTSVTMGDSVTSIGHDAFSDCSSLVKIYITDIAKWCGISFYSSGSNPLCNGANLYLNGELVKDLTIPDGVTKIKDYVFKGCSSLTSVTIPDSVTSIGSYAFYDCDSLTSVTIPDGVTSIGESTFYNCSSLTSVTIGNSVTSIGSYAFYDCDSLTSVTIPDSVTSIGNGAFESCSSLTSVTIPGSVTSIGYDAFYNCSSLKSVYITSLESWCNISFSENYSNPLYPNSNSKLYLNGEVVTHLDIPVGVTKINDYAFYGAECITSVVIPEGVEVIGSSAFYGCNNIETVTIPQSTVKIFDNAFYNCSSLKKVYYAGSADDWAEIIIDSENDHLKNAEIIYGVNIEGGEDEEETVSYIAVGNLGTAEWALLENGTVIINGTGVPSVTELPFYKYRDTITAVKISEGITAIPEDMFYKCSNITSVIIPASVTKIGDSAFWRCDAITDVYYCGTEAQWANIQIDEYNDILSSCAFTYNYSPVTVKAFKTLTKPQKVTYAYGEALEVEDMHVALFYSNNSFKEVEDFTVSGYDKCTFGRQEVTVSYEDQSFTMDVYVKPTDPSVLTTPLKAGMTVKEFSAPYSMLYTVCVFDDSMCKQLSDDDIITSGCVVQLVRDEKLMDSIGIVVSGDATCDGIVNGKDLIRIKKQINSGDAVEYTEYADINCDGIIDNADLECLIGMM